MVKVGNRLDNPPKVKTAGQRLVKRVWDYREMYLLLIPAFVAVLIFSYYPMYGVIMAFQNVKIGIPIIQNEWVGLHHIKKFFESLWFDTTMTNTVILAIAQNIIYPPFALGLALMLHNSNNKYIKKWTQSLTYIPHLLSTVVVISILRVFIARSSGLINNLFEVMGMERIDFLSLPEMAIPLYLIVGLWQNTGYSAVVYIGALASVDEQMVEAARIDGASKWRIIWNIQLPTIMPTVITMLILSFGSLFGASTERMLLLQTDLNIRGSEIIGTYLYKQGIAGARYGFSTAIGLFQNLLNICMMFLVNWLGDKFAGTSII